MVRGNKFKPAGKQSVNAAAATVEATVDGEGTAGPLTAAKTRQRAGKQSYNAVHPARGRDHAQPASGQTDVTRDAPKKQHNHGKGQHTGGLRAGQASHADVRDPTAAPERDSRPQLSGCKRRHREINAANKALSGLASEARPLQVTGAPQPAGNGLQHTQHNSRRRHTMGSGQQQAAAGGQGAPAMPHPAPKHVAAQQAPQQAGARTQHARKKRRLRAGNEATASAAIVTINGVEVRTNAAPPAKGELSRSRVAVTTDMLLTRSLRGSIKAHCSGHACMGCKVSRVLCGLRNDAWLC